MDIPSKNNASYSYDHVCDEHQTQAEIFESVGVPVTDAFLEGYHGCLIAYGQTGAGKTFTMQGPDDHSDGAEQGDGPSPMDDPEQQGLIPRVLQRIFQRIEDEKAGLDVNAGNAETALTPARGPRSEVEFTVKCSYLEIYNETVADLLAEPGSASQPNIREHDKKGVFVEGLIEASVTSAEETYDLFTRGSIHRRVGMTELNRESSRSHAVFTLSLESRRRPYPGAALQKRSALLHLVDLAGSERQRSTESAGVRLKEASAINKSLSALGNVIKALVDVADGKDRHVPYRDSKLTFLLKEALGGRARCTLLACVSPAAGQLEETLSTLKFAQRAKLVKVKARANEEAEGSVAELAAEVVRLRAIVAGGGGERVDDARARAGDLEAHVARANRVAAAAARDAATSVKNLESRLGEVEELARRLEKNLQSTKMVLRLREDALKKSKSTRSADPETEEAEQNAEMEQLRKMAECPPEVVRVRMEMQQLRARMERLEAENDANPAKGKMLRLETEMEEIREVRLREGEMAADVIERAAAADAAREETERMNLVLEAQRDASERAASESEEMAAAAKEARAAAEEQRVAAEMAKRTAEENMARVQATFDEQKALQEEMFGQIEALDAIRAQLEAQLTEANAAGDAARAEAEETKQALQAMASAKAEAEAAAEAAAASAASELEAMVSAKAEAEAAAEAAAASAASELEAMVSAKAEAEADAVGCGV